VQHHLSETDFQQIRAGATVPRPTLLHLDGCLGCRRAFGQPVTVPPPRGPRPWMLVAAAAVLGVAVIVTPLRTVAGNFLEVFQPRAVAFVPVTLADLRQMGHVPDLTDYGVGRTIRSGSERRVADPRSASALAGFVVRVPQYGIAAPQQRDLMAYEVMGPSSQQFMFSAAKARATAFAKHHAIAPMPPGLDGSTLDFELGSAVMATYESTLKQPRTLAQRAAGTASYTSAPSLFGEASGDYMPVAVGQMRAPRVYSTGASAAAIEEYLLRQPGFPPRLAAAFRAVGDPATTLPIPIPIDRNFAQPVIVDGVRGIGIGDETGLGAAVIWQRGDILYGVFAPLAARDVLAIADSLR
jgi:hypothetical protein